MNRLKPFATYLFLCVVICSSFLSKKLPKANQKVLEYVNSVIGTQVGSGECSDLIFNAQHYLKQELIKSNTKNNNILPGDFISFRNAIFTGSENKTIRFPNHQAIVYEVISQTDLVIAHQNHNDIKRVTTLHLNLSNLTSGTFNIDHP